MNRGFLEYILVNEVTGKVHESLLTTDASPLHLNAVLLLLGYASFLNREHDQKEDLADQTTGQGLV